MSIAAVLRELMAAGVQGEALVAAVDRIEKADKVEKGAARAARNRRYYEKRKASEQDDKTLKTTETADEAPPLDRFPLSQTQTPSLNPSRSDPDGSGSASEPGEPDHRWELFNGRGLRSLRRQTGKAPPACKTLFGKWLKMVGDSAVVVLAAVEAAEEAQVANPIAWIEAYLKREAHNHVSGTHYSNGHASGSGHRPSGVDAVAAGLAKVAHLRQLDMGGHYASRREARPERPSFDGPDRSDESGRHRAHYAA